MSFAALCPAFGISSTAMAADQPGPTAWTERGLPVEDVPVASMPSREQMSVFLAVTFGLALYGI